MKTVEEIATKAYIDITTILVKYGIHNESDRENCCSELIDVMDEIFNKCQREE